MPVFLLFAMNRTTLSDVRRIDAMKMLFTRNTRLITISESKVVDLGEHFTVDFQYDRGWKNVLGLVRSIVQTSHDVPVHAFLDYFWLETNYFKERYGLDWYWRKAPSLLEAGVASVHLPNAPEITSSLGRVPEGITYLFRHANTLSRVTDFVKLPDRGSHFTQLKRLGTPPFISFSVCSTSCCILYLFVPYNYRINIFHE